MWDAEVSSYISALEELSLVERTVDWVGEKFVLTPFLMSYVEVSIETLTKETYLKQICHYYLNMLGRCYKTIMVEDHISDQTFDLPKRNDSTSEAKSQVSNELLRTQSSPEEVRLSQSKLPSLFPEPSIVPEMSQKDFNKNDSGLWSEIKNIQYCIDYLICTNKTKSEQQIGGVM